MKYCNKCLFFENMLNKCMFNSQEKLLGRKPTKKEVDEFFGWPTTYSMDSCEKWVKRPINLVTK